MDSKLSISLPSVDFYNRYKISLSLGIYVLQNFWIIGKSYSDFVSIYYLLSWDKKYFDSVLKDGTIERDGITFNVIYYRTDPIKIKKHKGNLLLSFRAMEEIYKVNPVVLVTPA